MLPASPAIARWLLAHEAGGQPDGAALIAAAAEIHRQLRTSLQLVLGQTGFDSLWSRAMFLAEQSLPVPAQPREVDSLALLPGLRARSSTLAHDQIESVLLAALSSFIGLLWMFVGAELGMRLIQQIWPDYVPVRADDDTGEHPHD